jgi:hypothetical protein
MYCSVVKSRQYIPEVSELHIRRRENLKSHMIWNSYQSTIYHNFYYHMALQPKSGHGLPFWGFVTINFLWGWIVSPAPYLEDQASVFMTPGDIITFHIFRCCITTWVATVSLNIQRINNLLHRSELSSGMYCRVKWLSTHHFTRQYNQEDSSEHHTRRSENLKSQILGKLFRHSYPLRWRPA